MIEVLDPTFDESPSDFEPAPRLGSLEGSTVAVISNGKRGTVGFFDALESELRERYGVAEVVRLVKPNYSAPAGDDVFDQARRWQAVIAGIGD